MDEVGDADPVDLDSHIILAKNFFSVAAERHPPGTKAAPLLQQMARGGRGGSFALTSTIPQVSCLLLCLCHSDSSAPVLTIILHFCCAFIFVFVFLELLPSVPVSVGYTDLLCWLPDPVLAQSQTPGSLLVLLAVHADSSATPWRYDHMWP